jgi:hypothetical protein
MDSTRNGSGMGRMMTGIICNTLTAKDHFLKIISLVARHWWLACPGSV